MELTSRFATSGDKAIIDSMLTTLEAEILFERGGRLFLKDLHAKVDRSLSSCLGISESNSEIISDSKFPSPLTVILGYIDATCVGTVILEVEHQTQAESGTTGSLANILLIYVVPSSRECLIGEELLNEAKRVAKELLHCNYITGKTLPGDRAGKSLFENTGFKAQVITMGCSLENS